MRHTSTRRLNILPLLAVAVVFVGCAPGNGREATGEMEERTGQLEELQAKREATLQQLAAMDTEQLAAALAAESEKGREPFNSMALAETVKRGSEISAELIPHIRDADRRSFLALAALRKVGPADYAALDSPFRVAVLVDALAGSPTFNSWGLPHLYWEDSAIAIIDEGENAVPALVGLLRDTRDAPMWGSEEVHEYEQYQYRVCDYAWALLTEIRGEARERAIPKSVEERDKLIGEVLGSLEQ
jgi:hypothetical protein